MARSRSERGRHFPVPTAVVLVGVAISLAVYFSFEAAETAASTEQLANTGQGLVRVLEDLQAIALEQVLAIQAFYESSTIVTSEEFDHFVGIVGGPADNQLAYAHRVTDEGLEAFLALARTNRPEYSLSGGEVQLGSDRWLLLHSSAVDDVGYTPGFDFGSDPAIRRTIQSAFHNHSPVASSFVHIPGDDEAGDVVIVAPISQSGLPVGIALVTMTLDELLTERVSQLLGNGARLSLSDIGTVLDDSGRPGANRWVETVGVVGQEIRLTIDVAEEASTTSTSLWLLVFGIGTSILAGVLTYDRSRRRSMTHQVSDLQQTLAEKDRFLASVSHELRTPLTAVVGIIEILASRAGDLGEENAQLIRDVRISTQDLETVVEDHLTSARLTAGAITVNQDVVDLDVLVARAIAGTDRPDRLTIRIGELGTCRGDALRLRQIVRNIIRNAYRFAASEIEIRSNRTIDCTVLEILNDGPPISPQALRTLFEPFAKSSRPGQPEAIGLGLSVSHKLAQRMGGGLTYNYVDGKVKFTLSMPANVSVASSPVGTY